jgi:V8-like Glu-specific endopeptidase
LFTLGFADFASSAAFAGFERATFGARHATRRLPLNVSCSKRTYAPLSRKNNLIKTGKDEGTMLNSKWLWSSVALTMGLSACAVGGGDEGLTASELSTPDFTHTGVGALVFPRPDNGNIWNLCSGALISPTVFLTAGHCIEGAQYYADAGVPIGVSFDQQLTNGSPVIAASAMYLDPNYKPPHYNLNDDMHDLGVIILSQPVTDRPIYSMVSPGTLQPGTIHPGTAITPVGYGVDPNGLSGVPGYNQINTMSRDYGKLKYVNSSTAWLTANQTAGDGVCFGDSGGPSFMTFNGKERIVGVGSIINGYDCNEMTWLYRVDTAADRAFLGQFVTLP